MSKIAKKNKINLFNVLEEKNKKSHFKIVKLIGRPRECRIIIFKIGFKRRSNKKLFACENGPTPVLKAGSSGNLINKNYFSMHDNLLGLNLEFNMSFVSLPVYIAQPY
jgi:hypothetical protein